MTTSHPDAQVESEVSIDVPADFFDKLQEIYQNDVNLRDYWSVEEPTLRKVIASVVKEISFNYTLVKPLGVGGSGVVATVEDKNLRRKRALKVSRPSPGKERLLARVLQSETESLLRLSHPNLIQIFAQGAVSIDGQDYPYYVMEYVEGVRDSDSYLSQPGRTQKEVLQIFAGVLSAVEYLHSQGTIHMDLKPGNILVTPSCVPVISDLGFAKQLRIGGDYTLIGGTEGYIHPDARKLVQEAKSDPNRLRGEAMRTTLQEAWDLFSLGKTFLKLLEIIDEQNPKPLTPYARRYLKLLACRLLDGHNTDNERALGLSLFTFREIKYESVRQAKTDLDKLTGIYNLESRIPELNLHVQDTIQASTLATTPFTRRVRELLGHPALMRLGTFTQLGLLNLIYPTATHTRLEHSIGTFSVLCRYILALYNDPLNPLFRQIMREEDLRAALLSSLLHDVGHYPLAHDFEEAEPTLFSHEQIGYDLLNHDSSSLRALIQNDDGWAVPVSRVVSILQADPRLMRGSLKDRILHTLINGPVDADKIDYLMRDSVRLGLNYGKGTDLERLLRTLTIVFREQDGQTYAALGIHEKGKVPAEAIAFARYAMFGQVYWHHAYRSIKAMLQRMIWEMLFQAKDEKARRQYRDAFRRFVIPNDSGKRDQDRLFPLSDNIIGNPIHEVSQIQYGDLAMLYWLAERSGKIGSEFFDLFKSRRLFKRILVLSSEKIPDKTLWSNLLEFYGSNKRNWRKKLRLQRAFQERIVELVETPPETPPQTAVITPDARNHFLAEGRDKALLLIDIPPERKGSDIPLEFIVEEDRRRVKSDEMRTGNLEQSILWKALHESFQVSIGKLRVFCHPDHAEFLTAYLSRPTIENALSSALNKVEAE
jgi:HD superfamily phosphohydrolase